MISFLWYENSQKVTKKSQNLLKVLPKTVLFRNIALIFSLEKPCYLENRVVREPCKRRSVCTYFWQLSSTFLDKIILYVIAIRILQGFISLEICFFQWEHFYCFGFFSKQMATNILNMFVKSFQKFRWLCSVTFLE